MSNAFIRSRYDANAAAGVDIYILTDYLGSTSVAKVMNLNP
jgi:hypothetical protein